MKDETKVITLLLLIPAYPVGGMFFSRLIKATDLEDVAIGVSVICCWVVTGLFVNYIISKLK